MGSYVKIESKNAGVFTACDIVVIAKETDQAAIDALKADYKKCEGY